jgi:plastocyanin
MRFTKVALTVGTFALIACGGSGDGGGTNPPPPGTVSSVTLNRSSAVMKPTESVTITATPKNASGNAISGKTVTWTASPASGTVSLTPNGSQVTVTGTADGTAQVKATVDQVNSPSATITVTSTIASSADVTVGSGGDVFTPDQADISAGGTVNFTWAAGPHNVTWTAGPTTPANSGDRSSGSFSVTLPQAGTYSYHCTIHAGMNGSVTVH